MTFYESILKTKNETLIPVLKSGKTLESRYNPQEDATRKVKNTEISTSFALVLGIGSGIFLEKLAASYPKVTFLAFENTKEDILFLSKLDSFQKLYKIKNIHIFSMEEMENVLPVFYIPSFYGNLKIIEQRAWIEENPEISKKISAQIDNVLKKISADFSVQAHFGKIWQNNILKNLKLLSKYKQTFQISPDLSKTAAIIAAGPSLDKTINFLKNQKNYFIISTDTAFQTLAKHNISPDLVLSIDGQSVSYNHFFNIKKDEKNPIFIFDLCGNSSAAEKLLHQNQKIFFTNSNHPFANYINSIENQFPNLFSGAGTVTIAALDLALQLGFKKISIFGADFSYSNGKTYTKGTYLDSLYQKTSNHLFTYENYFNKLLFRTQLIQKKDKELTTEVLNSYRISLEDFLKEKNCNFFKKDFIYEIQTEKNQKFPAISNQIVDFGRFYKDFKNNFENINFQPEDKTALLQNKCILSLLPFIANLRIKKENSEADFEQLAKLAYKNILRYN